MEQLIGLHFTVVQRDSMHRGLKDLVAVKGYKTMWGSVPYQDQVIDLTATVARKLEEAGAVLVAKLSLGELAMDDECFGGVTRNPWDFAQLHRRPAIADQPGRQPLRRRPQRLRQEKTSNQHSLYREAFRRS